MKLLTPTFTDPDLAIEEAEFVAETDHEPQQVVYDGEVFTVIPITHQVKPDHKVIERIYCKGNE